MNADVATLILITVESLVLEKVTRQQHVVCLTVQSMAVGEPGLNGQIVRAIVE